MRELRVLLHTGKGGVGKSTVAAATAVAAAAAGRRTLLLSTDPAHSVADILGLPLSGDPTPVPGADGLWAAQVDVRGRFEQAWSSIREYLTRGLAAGGLSQVQAEELTVLPGADEIIALLEVADHAAAGRFDAIVVDCAPTGETLRLLALPETVQLYADRLMSLPSRLLRGLGQGWSGLLGGRPTGLPDRDAVLDLLDRLRRVRQLLTDPERAGVRIVLTPERVVVAEARRLRTGLALHGYPLDGVVVNRVLPLDAGGELLSGWVRAQGEALALIEESFGDVTRWPVGWAATEPVGVLELQDLAVQLFDGQDPMGPVPGPPASRVESSADGYELRWPLPLADRSQMNLGRVGDDLVVTLGQYRRRMTLPSLLRRCQVAGARFEAEELVVDFVPDPQAWPQTVPTAVAG